MACRLTAMKISHPGEEVVTLQAAIPSLYLPMHNAYPRWVGGKSFCEWNVFCGTEIYLQGCIHEDVVYRCTCESLSV